MIENICDKIAHELDVSRWSVNCIPTEHLKMPMIAARCCPTFCQKAIRKPQSVKVTRKPLQRLSEEDDEMLQRIVALDKKWMRSFESESNRNA